MNDDEFVVHKELNTALRSLQEKLEHKENIEGEFEKTVRHIKSQAEHTESQIKQQFEKLHQFLRDDEEATITELREEVEQKKRMMKEKLEEMDRHISDLSHTIKDMEEMMKANDVCFLKEFPVSMERVQISQPDPQMASGALIHVPRYLGNLPFRVWKKMQDIVQNTPVILDPNTVNQHLILSDDLTSLGWNWNKQPLPDNPERFDECWCVLGSEGFNSGTHSWEVEVEECRWWCLGVTNASNQRKGGDMFNTDVWSVEYDPYEGSGSDEMLESSNSPVEQDLERVRVDLDYDRGTMSFSDPVTNTHLHTFWSVEYDPYGVSRSDEMSETSNFPVEQDLERVRVDLDYDRGTMSFSDPVTNTHLHTFTTTFTDTLFPFFRCFSSLRILPVNSQ
ncbi:E3 ubiquitin-protein ligase TRIM35-like [Siphateles boraxobius]|uniref:E3 ubiquitin-protein ligase TRIM35-like n=1 Tax=Siphateles boraxobius TaxID=180520 RepID=UPI004063795D